MDNEDCLALIRSRREEIDFKLLKARFKETASFDVAEDGVIKNWEYFLRLAEKEGLYYEKK